MEDIKFIKRHMDSSILPSFTQVKHHLGRNDHQQILVKVRKYILRAEIQSTRPDLAWIYSQVFSLHLKLASIIIVILWNLIDFRSHFYVESFFIKIYTYQKFKFSNIYYNQSYISLSSLSSSTRSHLYGPLSLHNSLSHYGAPSHSSDLSHLDFSLNKNSVIQNPILTLYNHSSNPSQGYDLSTVNHQPQFPSLSPPIPQLPKKIPSSYRPP